MRWLSVIVCACGARTGLDAPEDASLVVVKDASADAHDAARETASDGALEAEADGSITGCFTSTVVTLAKGQDPTGLLVDDAYVYWPSQFPNFMRRVKKTGGPVEDLYSMLTQTNHAGITMDDSFIYSGAGPVQRGPKSGGMPTTVVASDGSAYGMEVSGSTLFWGEISGHVRSVPKGGGTSLLLDSPKGGVTDVAIDGGFVYFSTWYPPDGGVWKVPVGGGTTTQLAATAYSNDIAVDATSVYWISPGSSSGPGGVWRVPKQGGTITTLAKNNDPHGLVIDATYAYWADFHDVWKVPKSGGTPTLVAPSQQNARVVAVDDACAYWTLDPIVGEIRVGPK